MASSPLVPAGREGDRNHHDLERALHLMRQYISYLVTTSRRILRLYPGYKVNLAVVAWYSGGEGPRQPRGDAPRWDKSWTRT